MPPADPAAAMRKAIADKNVAKVKQLIASGISPNIEIYKVYKTTPLIGAVNMGSEDMVQALIEAGADINKQDKEGNTPLMYSAHNETIANMLLNAGANINIQNRKGDNALMSFIIKQSPLVFRLIDEGADVHAEINFGNTSLQQAVSSARGEIGLNIVKRLIQKGVDLNMHSPMRKSPLVRAALDGKLEIVQELIRAGADRSEIMYLIRRQAENINENVNNIRIDRLEPNIQEAILNAFNADLPPPPNRIIPRRVPNSTNNTEMVPTHNIISGENIQNGNILTNFRGNAPNSFESSHGRYYKRGTVRKLKSHPFTRGPILEQIHYTARFSPENGAASGGRRRRKTKRSHRRRSTRKAH